MKLYGTTHGIFVEQQDCFYSVPATDWDELIRSTDLLSRVEAATIGTSKALLFVIIGSVRGHLQPSILIVTRRLMCGSDGLSVSLSVGHVV